MWAWNNLGRFLLKSIFHGYRFNKGTTVHREDRIIPYDHIPSNLGWNGAENRTVRRWPLYIPDHSFQYTNGCLGFKSIMKPVNVLEGLKASFRIRREDMVQTNYI